MVCNATNAIAVGPSPNGLLFCLQGIWLIPLVDEVDMVLVPCQEGIHLFRQDTGEAPELCTLLHLCANECTEQVDVDEFASAYAVSCVVE